jgi:hypothetical protein
MENEGGSSRRSAGSRQVTGVRCEVRFDGLVPADGLAAQRGTVGFPDSSSASKSIERSVGAGAAAKMVNTALTMVSDSQLKFKRKQRLH